MTKAALKKHLKTMEKAEIIDLMLELYDAKKEAKEYLDYFLNPQEDAKLDEYKRIIREEFYPKRGFPKCRFSVCRKAISDFKKLGSSPISQADLMLFLVEQATELTDDMGDMWEQYYDSAISNLQAFMKFADRNGFLPYFDARLQRLVKLASNIGWGYGDMTREIYYEYCG